MKTFNALMALALCALALPLNLSAQEASEIIRSAVEYWRDTSSYIEATMTIHRPDWERSLSFLGWTSGNDKSLIRFTSPAKDAGSASLTIENDMWSYSPKVNKVVRIPPSMRTQSWMGSDFSYQDLAKADDIIEDYTHKLVGKETSAAKEIYLIESIPKESAPVVWGKETFKIRADKIILEHDFYDQDMKLVKHLFARDITEIGGKLYAKVVRIEQVETKDEWTEIIHSKAEFGIKIPESVFTLSNLATPRK